MRTIDVNCLRELPSPLAPGATPRIVKLTWCVQFAVGPSSVLLCTFRCEIFTVAAPAVRAVLSLDGSRRVQRPLRSR
jgi:hypothetical protein